MKQREYINPEDKAGPSFYLMAAVILLGVAWDRFVFTLVNFSAEMTIIFIGVMLGVVFSIGLIGTWWWLLSEVVCVLAFVAIAVLRRVLEDAMDISKGDKP